MAEPAGPVYFMIDINCGAKSVHSGFIKVDKHSQTVGDMLSEGIPKDYLINDIFISEGEGKPRRNVPLDMAFENLLYINTNCRHFTVFVTKIKEVGETSTAGSIEKPSALDILKTAAKSYTHLPEKRSEKTQKGKLYIAILAVLKENQTGFLPHQCDKTGQKVDLGFSSSSNCKLKV